MAATTATTATCRDDITRSPLFSSMSLTSEAVQRCVTVDVSPELGYLVYVFHPPTIRSCWSQDGDFSVDVPTIVDH